MQTTKLPSMLTLLLLVTVAAVNAVLFTPALPSIQSFFGVGVSTTQLTISLYLIGYAIGQLLYGPLANRFGIKHAIYYGMAISFVGALLCMLSSPTHHFIYMALGRFLMALGSSVGLMISFAIVMHCYPQELAKQKISHLLAGFGIAPGVSIMIGGILVQHFGWQSCFYFLALYGLAVTYMCSRLPQFNYTLDLSALKCSRIIYNYVAQLKNLKLAIGSLLMGFCTAYVYVFAAEAPFIGMKLIQMKPSEYGLWALLPSLGILIGSYLSAKTSQNLSTHKSMAIGFLVMGLGIMAMLIGLHLYLRPQSLFISMFIILIGYCLIYIQASSIALNGATDRANASAMMSFINMAICTIAVFGLSAFHHTLYLMPLFFIGLFIAMGALTLGLKLVK
ncbi:MAG: MFS transporter [Gammaproteobacteria bacterium]|nr:MFS transporter [Gammaproteobacteria bacterium]